MNKISLVILLVVALAAAQRPTCTADQAKTFTKGCYDCIQAGCSWCNKASGGSFCVNSTATTAASAGCNGVSETDGTTDEFLSGDPSTGARNACAKCGSGNDCNNDCTGRPHCGKCHMGGSVCSPYDTVTVNGVTNITKIWACSDARLFTTDSCDAPCAFYANSQGPCLGSGRNCWFCPRTAGSDSGTCTTANDAATCAAGYIKPAVVTVASSSSFIAIPVALIAIASFIL